MANTTASPSGVNRNFAGPSRNTTDVNTQLIASVETHKLDEWESGDVVARPLALLYRCLERTEGDPGTRQALYLRICRLDPVQAIGFANGGGASA